MRRTLFEKSGVLRIEFRPPVDDRMIVHCVDRHLHHDRRPCAGADIRFGLTVVRVGRQARERRRNARAITAHDVHVVVGLAAVVPVVDTAGALDPLQVVAEHRIAEVHLVCRQLGDELARILPVHAPVDLSLPFRVGDRSPPAAVAVPLALYGGNVADIATRDHVRGALVKRQTVVLESGLKHLLLARPGRRRHLQRFIDALDHRFLAIADF